MDDERKAQDQPQDELQDTKQRSVELSEEELDTVAGGLGSTYDHVINAIGEALSTAVGKQ